MSSSRPRLRALSRHPLKPKSQFEHSPFLEEGEEELVEKLGKVRREEEKRRGGLRGGEGREQGTEVDFSFESALAARGRAREGERERHLRQDSQTTNIDLHLYLSQHVSTFPPPLPAQVQQRKSSPSTPRLSFSLVVDLVLPSPPSILLLLLTHSSLPRFSSLL